MTVVAVDKDLANRKLTLVAAFEADPTRVWNLWADPRQLERWWGPPGLPLTVTAHDLRRGGEVAFFVVGTDGGRREGSWTVHTVEPPHRLTFDLHSSDFPTTEVVVDIADREQGGAAMTTTIDFGTEAAMDALLEIGFDQGMTTTIEQAVLLLRT